MSLLKLTNAPFEIEFNGKPYMVKKATLAQTALFMQKAEQMKTDKIPAYEQLLKLVVYCLYVILSPQDSSITEQFIEENIPGNINPLEILITLGFMNPKLAAPTPVVTEKSTTA